MTDDGFLWTKFLPGLQIDKEEMYRILLARGIQRPVLHVWSCNDPTVSHEQAGGLYRILAEKERPRPLADFRSGRPFQFSRAPQALQRGAEKLRSRSVKKGNYTPN